MNSSGTHSSSNSAVPEENKAADNRLCTTCYLIAMAAFSRKTIKLSERTEITEGSGTEATLYSSWCNRSGEHQFWLKGQGQPVGKETEKWQFPPLLSFSHHMGYVSYSAPPVPGTGWAIPNGALTSTPATSYNNPGKQPQPLPTACGTKLRSWKGWMKEKAAS